MKVQEIINNAFEEGLLKEPSPQSSLFIIVDTDGCIVSVPVTHEFMEDTEHDVKEYVTQKLLLKRAEVRSS